MSDHGAVAEHFQTREQQNEAARLGMWAFLATEILLFGGVFTGIMAYRVAYSDVLEDASQHLHLWIGGANTVVLLTSSLTIALAVVAARAGHAGRTLGYLLVTALLGIGFLGVKGYEYYKEYHGGFMPGAGPEFPLDVPAMEMFFNLYFTATGLHAFHLTGGVLAVLVFCIAIGAGRLRLPAQETRVENLGLYWHLVDVIWVFLYPVLYLV